jgi:hypothetical protein
LDLVLGMCLCFLSIQWLVNPTGSIFKWQGIDSLLMALLVSLTIAFTFSEDRTHSIVGQLDWARVIALYFGSRFVFVRAVNERSWRRFVWISALVLLVIGAIQAFTGTTFGLIGNYFGAGSDQGVTASMIGVGSRGRVSGSTTNPIIFAMWMTMFSLLVASDLNAKRRHVPFVVLSLVSAVVLSTLSCGAITAALSCLILVFISWREMFRIVFSSVIVMMFLIPLVYLGILKLGLQKSNFKKRQPCFRLEWNGKNCWRRTEHGCG